MFLSRPVYQALLLPSSGTWDIIRASRYRVLSNFSQWITFERYKWSVPLLGVRLPSPGLNLLHRYVYKQSNTPDYKLRFLNFILSERLEPAIWNYNLFLQDETWNWSTDLSAVGSHKFCYLCVSWQLPFCTCALLGRCTLLFSSCNTISSPMSGVCHCLEPIAQSVQNYVRHTWRQVLETLQDEFL